MSLSGPLTLQRPFDQLVGPNNYYNLINIRQLLIPNCLHSVKLMENEVIPGGIRGTEKTVDLIFVFSENFPVTC